LFYGDISDDEFAVIKSYLINPVECRGGLWPSARTESPCRGGNLPSDLDLSNRMGDIPSDPETVETLSDFRTLNADEMKDFCERHSINMDMDDALFCQQYFKKENRDPTITEMRVFDTYWSDHCRHSTFMTILDSVEIDESIYSPAIKDAAARYYAAKEQIGSSAPHCLMDVAVMGMKKMRHIGLIDDMEDTDEVNACSIEVDVTVDGKPEKWLFMFKNETHNHPTEIEPFGGASTCLGGGIRDPLSGRAFVHGAIRLTGSGDPREPYAETLRGKLPQRKITKTAAEGYSSYSNQIGLASGHLSEIYDPGFRAKRMECGALVAGVKKEDVTRLQPVKGDVIVLIGGNTGRDGIGGATGSSKEHDESSLEKGGAEVQKGNPAIERNIVRLFRDPKASKLIKKCNDFGAGGVSVAVCELADSLVINLDTVPLKYGGLDGTEIAISESQERMAVLLDAADLKTFAAMAENENLQCVKVADVTDDKRVIMRWKNNVIVDIAAEMLNSGGVRKHASVKVAAPKTENLRLAAEGVSDGKTITENWLANISDLNTCSKEGIADRFDTTSAGNTILMPFGGKYQKTPEQGLCIKFPARLGKCGTASLMTLGYNPKLGYFSPFHQAVYAVLESVMKLAAMGGDASKARLTFQEYFEKLGNDPYRWGKPYAALMGAFLAQDELKIPSIGGKDSMSGTFTDIDVPPSLISFAVGTADTGKIVSSAFKGTSSKVVMVYSDLTDDKLPNWEQTRSNLRGIHWLIQNDMVLASSAVGFGGVAAAVSKMCFGNRLGFSFTDENIGKELLFTPDYTAVILEVTDNVDLSGLHYRELGVTTEAEIIKVNGAEICLGRILEAYEGTLAEVFPSKPLAHGKQPLPAAAKGGSTRRGNFSLPDEVKGRKVIIPIFPGTNGEYELEDWFAEAGASVNTVIFKTLSLDRMANSIAELADKLSKADILAIPSGMSAGCEPCGSAKFIAAVLKKPPVRRAIESLIARKGLILGVGEGFAALIRTGLLPYGRYTERTDAVIERNTVNKYMCRMVNVRLASVNSPWFKGYSEGDMFTAPLSILEGRVIISAELYGELSKNGQIAAQYVDENGEPSMDVTYNPCGADYAIECMTNPDGRIMGRMCSFERLGKGLYQNI
ncbi:MAG: phosphoribosylformylglycinamidine synthase, partial [Oscillospiraceae bacterium]|nr:phosphoribosylformylglycinamidine synthase [Oscillospiraceae bacterium]